MFIISQTNFKAVAAIPTDINLSVNEAANKMSESSSPRPSNGASHTNGGSSKGNSLPELAHVTNNIIPLSNVLRFYTQDAYSQLSRMIDNLSKTRTLESDNMRKKKFLELIVSLRQDFIKLYTLVKWAQRAKDVSKLIDLLNWLRTQDFYFDNLAMGLNELNNFSGAKLPNSDILTAMEVLVKGRPQLPSYDYIENPPISAKKTLEVLHDLNLTLTARMALLDDLPPRFVNNYVVRDGRVVVTIPNEFQVSFTVANDLIIEGEDDYYKSPFFFIDFAFLFGINPDTSLITHKDARVITTLPKSSREKLENTLNQILLKESLFGLYKILHNYANSFKLYLISRQLRDLSINSKWRGIIQYKYQPSLVIINYWSNQYLSRNWKSFIEIGIDKNYALNFRWFKNGRYELDHGITELQGDSGEVLDSQDLNVDSTLSLIINKHSELHMSRIFEAYSKVAPDSSVSMINPYQMLLTLTPRKQTIFAINPLSGYFYFLNPSSIEMSTESKINGKPQNAKSSGFIGESSMIASVVNNLILLRVESLAQMLQIKLATTQWIVNDFITLNEYESIKLFNFLSNEKVNQFDKTIFVRRLSWPSSWFLISMISGATSKLYWWVARLRSIKGAWKIQWVQKINSASEHLLDYKFFKNLSRTSSDAIIRHLIVEELQKMDIGSVAITNQQAYRKFSLSSSFDPEKETIMALYNTGNLLPVSVCSTTLFLKICFLNETDKTHLKLSIAGFLRNMNPSYAKSLHGLGVTVDEENDQFILNSSLDLSTKLSESIELPGGQPMLGPLMDNLAKLNLLLKVLDQLDRSNIEIQSNLAEEISFEIDQYYKPFVLRISNNEDRTFILEAADTERDNVKILVKILNEDLATSNTALVGSFRYLREVANIFKAIDTITRILGAKNKNRLANNLLKLHFELSFTSLNQSQLIFWINDIHQNSKRVLRDKIVFGLSLKSNRFSKNKLLVIKFSMKDNFNSQNLKFKELFELIFKAASELQQDATKTGKLFTRLNYDFLMDSSFLSPYMLKITEAFIQYLEASS